MTCENLHVEEQHQLKKLLQKDEHLFEGTLGKFNIEHIEKISLQVHVRAYTAPRSVEQ
jgi:hypothetical protein